MAPDPFEKTGNSSPKPQKDRILAALAARQHGAVASWQLKKLGFTDGDIKYRVAIGRLHRIHRGAYAVGYRTLTREGHWMAAVLAYGPDALISHRTACALWSIGTSTWKLEVTTPHAKRSRPGTKVHTASLHREDIGRCNRIPVTTVARTILDVSAEHDEDRLARLLEDADRRELLHLPALERAMARRPRAPGTPRLKLVLADYRGPRDTRSKHERFFRRLIARAGLPEPHFNVLVAGVLVDAHWPQWKLVVEIDSRAFHTGPRAFERDRIRDAKLQKAGYRVLRITEKRLYSDPPGVIADILALARLTAS